MISIIRHFLHTLAARCAGRVSYTKTRGCCAPLVIPPHLHVYMRHNHIQYWYGVEFHIHEICHKISSIFVLWSNKMYIQSYRMYLQRRHVHLATKSIYITKKTIYMYMCIYIYIHHKKTYILTGKCSEGAFSDWVFILWLNEYICFQTNVCIIFSLATHRYSLVAS